VLTGTVSDEGVPIIMLPVADQIWPGFIDTGFNGDVELPEALRESLNARFIGRISSLLASGQHIEQDVYLVDFPFDGETVRAEATGSKTAKGRTIALTGELWELIEQRWKARGQVPWSFHRDGFPIEGVLPRGAR
jgi:predicted aspartyl protease